MGKLTGRFATALVAAGCLALQFAVAGAQQPKAADPAPPADARPAPPRPEAPPLDLRESVQADVSTRSVAVTSSFTGTEIVVFGAVDNSHQRSAEAGLYDIVIVLEGTPTRLTARRKAQVAGVWMNTQSITFESVPSYYAIVSTRPLDEIADSLVLREQDIGFQYVRMTPIRGWQGGITTADLADFKESVVRLKQRDGLYVEEEYGVSFLGRSLFRATIALPANVPVGPLETRVHLFREGRLLSTYRARVTLRREGVERLLHSFAIGYPLIYGLFAVACSVLAGLGASALLKRVGG